MYQIVTIYNCNYISNIKKYLIAVNLEELKNFINLNTKDYVKTIGKILSPYCF
jgi:hypothetical protein